MCVVWGGFVCLFPSVPTGEKSKDLPLNFFLNCFFFPSLNLPLHPQNSNIWAKMFPRLYTEELLHYLMRFLVQVHHILTWTAPWTCLISHTACPLPGGHGDPGTLLTQIFQPTSLISSRNLCFPLESSYFSHIYVSQKFGVFVKIYFFLADFFQSIPHEKLKPSPVGREKSSFSVGWGFAIAMLSQTGVAGISGCMSGDKGRGEKKAICSLKLYNQVCWQ